MHDLEKPGPGQNLYGSTRHIFRMALMAKGNKSYINIGVVKLREMNPIASFRETRPRETKPRSKFVWVD